MLDLESIPILPLHNMLDILPQFSLRIDLTRVLSDLMASEFIVDQGWAPFQQDTERVSGREHGFFEAMSQVFDAIVQACSVFEGKPSAIKCLCQHNTAAPTSSEYSGPHDTKGYLMLASEPSKTLKGLEETDSDDVVAPWEWKRSESNSDSEKNSHEVIRNMHYVLKADPTRRFTFGITTENFTTRVWLMHRSTTIVSEAFNFMKDHEKLVRVVISLAFASKQELGWDPSFRRVSFNHGMSQYEIDIHQRGETTTRTYTTTEVIFDLGSEALGPSTGTRVFKARDKDGTVVVLKDSWVLDDLVREGESFEKILATVKKKHGEDAVAEAQKHFLTVIADGDVLIHGRQDHTLDLIMRGQDLSSDHDVLKQLMDDNDTQGSMKTDSEQSQSYAKIYHRAHYRIVFKEFGTSVIDSLDIHKIFDALRDTVKALKIMHDCGFVHRDVTPANILFVDDRSVLFDFEYVKEMSLDSVPDARTGTPAFMAVEVAHASYLFGNDQQPFKYNPLHDLESVWWDALWALFIQTDPSAPNPKQESHFCCIFPFSAVESTKSRRLDVFWHPFLKQMIADLHPLLQESARVLEEAIVGLVSRYIAAERGDVIDPAAFEDSHEFILNVLIKASSVLPARDLVLRKFGNQSSLQPKKKRSGSSLDQSSRPTKRPLPTY